MTTKQAQAGITEPIVLLVDDDPTVLEALSSLLTPRLEPLFRVETAASGEDAMELLSGDDAEPSRSPVALVISDEKMPGMSGNDLLIALREHPAHRHGGRIIVTAYADLASAKRAINDSEVDRYYPKPWDTEGDLLPAIRDVLTRFASRSRLDGFLLASVAEGPADVTAVQAVRRDWWSYLTLLDPDDPDVSNMDVPSFQEPEDVGARHIIARHMTPVATRQAAAIRLRPDESGDAWLLDRLAFSPEDAGDEVELLVLRAALLHAGQEGIPCVRTDAPVLRREVYERVGFVSEIDCI